MWHQPQDRREPLRSAGGSSAGGAPAGFPATCQAQAYHPPEVLLLRHRRLSHPPATRATRRVEDIDGAAIETLVLEALRAENAGRGLGYDLFFWRTFDGKEVDFVLYGESGLHAFEVKRTSRFREEDLNGLRAFCGDYPEAKGCLLYGGEKRYRFDKIDVVPLAQGLMDMGERLTA